MTGNQKKQAEEDNKVNESVYDIFDFYRSNSDKSNISYQLMLKTRDEQTWCRSDDSITGTWLQFEDKIYLNYDYPEEDCFW